jgi:flagellar biogenesis protein FliO
MLARFSRQLARPKAPLPDFTNIAGLIARWLAMPSRRATTRSLRLLESVSLTAQASVALVRCGTETLILGVTAHNITVLGKGAALEDASEQQAQRNSKAREE